MQPFTMIDHEAGWLDETDTNIEQTPIPPTDRGSAAWLGLFKRDNTSAHLGYMKSVHLGVLGDG